MKTFYQWAEEKKLELPPLQEKTARGGIMHWAYPDAYVRQQYPDGYFMAHSADAMQKMGNKKVDRKAAPANTPG
jgi:hypothetical protein